MIIIYILAALLGIAIVAFVAGYIRNRRLEKKLQSGEIDEMPTVVTPNSECCGQHAVCEKESLLAAVPLPDALKDEVFLIVGERRFDR